MPSTYRSQRRQGVVYGPVGPPGGGGGTTLLGTLLGVLVVLVAMALLAVAAFGLIGDLTGGPSLPPSQLAQASATPAGSQGTGSTDTAEPSGSQPSGSPGAQPTPTDNGPTPTPQSTFVPQIEEGPGFITFGTKTNKGLRITDARVTFSSDDPTVVWSAYLSSPANAADLHVQIFKLDPSAKDGKRLLWDHQLTIHAKGAQIYKSHLRTHTALDGPGVYEVQYLRGDELLSDGYFQFIG